MTCFRQIYLTPRLVTAEFRHRKHYHLGRFCVLSVLVYLCMVFPAAAQTIAAIDSSRIHLPNGWAISPVGKSLPLGDLPLNMAVSPSGDLLAITNNGQSDQSITLIDAIRQVVLDTILVG